MHPFEYELLIRIMGDQILLSGTTPKRFMRKEDHT
jgi:hypothetical protein